MSDLASFVAATIRDKVVQDLQEENDQLRNEMAEMAEENSKVIIWDAFYGLGRVHRIAIVVSAIPRGEVTPLVFAIDHLYPDTQGVVVGSGFTKVSDCHLGNLARAFLYVNGHRLGRMAQFQCMISFDAVCDNDRYEDGIMSVRELVDPQPSKMDLDNFCFQVMRNAAEGGVGIDMIFFGLKDVSSVKLFELFEMDIDELRANPRDFTIYREFSIDQLIDCFGADTVVLFREADDINF